MNHNRGGNERSKPQEKESGKMTVLLTTLAVFMLFAAVLMFLAWILQDSPLWTWMTSKPKLPKNHMELLNSWPKVIVVPVDDHELRSPLEILQNPPRVNFKPINVDEPPIWDDVTPIAIRVADDGMPESERSHSSVG